MNALVHPHLLPPTSGILLDQENFGNIPNLEIRLSDHASFPLVVKIAAGNFNNREKTSLSLHKQGYTMLHVPSLKNAADAQIILTGSLLFLNNPQVREVFICSNDQIFSFLKNSLNQLGKKAWLVKRQEEKIYIGGQQLMSQEINQPQVLITSITNSQQLQKVLLTLLKQTLAQQKSKSIKATLLGTKFHQQYGKGINLVLTQLKIKGKFVKYLEQIPQLKISKKNNQYHVSI